MYCGIAEAGAGVGAGLGAGASGCVMPGLTGGKVGTPSAFAKPDAEPNCGMLVVIGFGAGFGAAGTAPSATDGLEDCGFIISPFLPFGFGFYMTYLSLL